MCKQADPQTLTRHPLNPKCHNAARETWPRFRLLAQKVLKPPTFGLWPVPVAKLKPREKVNSLSTLPFKCYQLLIIGKSGLLKASWLHQLYVCLSTDGHSKRESPAIGATKTTQGRHGARPAQLLPITDAEYKRGMRYQPHLYVSSVHEVMDDCEDVQHEDSIFAGGCRTRCSVFMCPVWVSPGPSHLGEMIYEFDLLARLGAVRGHPVSCWLCNANRIAANMKRHRYSTQHPALCPIDVGRHN